MRAGFSFCAIILLLTAGVAGAQSRIEGSAVALDGSPLAGATVLLEAPGVKVPLSTTVGDDGSYVFEKVTPGTRVRLTVTRGGRVVVSTYALVTLWVERVDLKEATQEQSFVDTDGISAAGGQSADVGGIVRDRAGRVVASALVAVPDTTISSMTDATGRFLLPALRPGVNLTIDVTAEGFGKESTSFVIPRGGRQDVEVILETPEVSNPWRSEGSLISTVDGASRAILRQPDADVIPGIAGDDLLRATQSVPGVTAGFEAPDRIGVRGGTPGDILTTFDGMTLYHVGAVFGTVGGLNPAAVHDARVLKASFGAADGGHLSGAVHLSGEAPMGGRPTGYLGASMLGGEALVRLPLGERVSLTMAGRHSSPEELYAETLDRLSAQGTTPVRTRAVRFGGGTFDADSTPAFRDINARLDLAPSRQDRLSVSVFDGRGVSNHSHDVSVPGTSAFFASGAFVAPADAFVEVGDVSGWEAKGIGASWTRQWAPAVSTKFSFGRTSSTSSSARASLLTSPTTGLDYSYDAGRGGTQAWSDENHVTDTSARLDTTLAFGYGHVVSFGGEVKRVDADYQLARERFRYTPATRTMAPEMASLLDRTDAGRLLTFYAQDAWRPTPRLSLTPGFRVTHFDVTGDVYVEPKVEAALQLSRNVRLRSGYALDHQMVGRITHEDRLQGDRSFWAMADGATVPVARSQQVALGALVTGRGLSIDIEGYYKTLDDVALFAPRLYPGVAPAATDRLFHVGTGRAFGAEVLLQHSFKWNTFRASYTAQRAEYDYPTLEAATFLSSAAPVSEVVIADSLRATRWLTLTAAWYGHTGRAYTPATGIAPVWLPSGTAVYDVVFGAKNSEDLPVYHRLDVSAHADVTVGGVKARVGATVFNVYNQRNTWYSEYHTAGQTIASDEIVLMGRALNVFLKIGF